ncbi:PQQ-dependent sugar dehydrogenase, partial [Candidatus Dojkabacteria bacterium]|nr:PQQ-dependent sugar dehydrogenase [Candidatus Dojkabacteria bacterium]
FTYGLVKPRGIAFDDSNNLWIVDQSANSLYVVIDNDKDGFAEENLLVDSSLDSPHGLEYYLGDLYVGEKSQISVYRDITSEGTYSSKEIIVPDLPFDGHTSKTVRIGPDERLYVASGSSCNVCEESDPRRAAISVYNLDGSNHSIYASGLRNTVDFAFYGGKIWGVNNGRDQIGDDVPPEEVNIIEEGEHYGWPYCYGQGITNPEYPEKEDFCRNEAIGSTYDMQAHSAPLGMDFFPTNTSFPDSLNENMFIGFHGSWNRTVPTGYKIVRLNIFDRNAETINFITGWLDPESGEAWGRPVDVKFDHNGDMYISDDKAGVVYRVTYID